MLSSAFPLARRASALTACLCALAVAAPLAAQAKTHRPAPPPAPHHVPRGAKPAAKPRAHAADIRWNADGATFAAGARCDAFYQALSFHTLSNVAPGYGYTMAWVYDLNAKRYIYQSNWLAENTWTELMMQHAFAPLIRAAIYAQYAHYVNGAWSYSGEWVSSFSQDDVPGSSSCTF
jgi:hypothetical protein